MRLVCVCSVACITVCLGGDVRPMLLKAKSVYQEPASGAAKHMTGHGGGLKFMLVHESESSALSMF